jgi:ubiquinone/menaquinone biosynthesis C-methylase UbiE
VQFAESDGIPVLLSRNEKFQSAQTIGDAYDDIYTRHSDVWNDQGRTPEFIQYFAGLVKLTRAQKMLEIGCGEGFLLSAMSVPEKTAVDISAEALRKARMKTSATLGVALAERLPFADGAFDLAVSAGVMEHFIDAREATREVWRVLRSGGWYVMLIHVALGFQGRVALKFAEYIFPNFRPAALARWISKKATSPVIQPIQRRFTEETVADCLRGSGLEVTRVISRRSDPKAPLSGPHVLIFIAKKPDVSRQATGPVRTP